MNNAHFRAFEENGRVYGDGKPPNRRPEAQWFLPWIPEGARVLDLGCGDGSVSQKIAQERKAKLCGIEIDPAGVEEARSRGIDARVGNIDEGLDFPNDSFDIVVLSSVLVMVYRPGFVLRESLRVAPRVICSFPNFGYWIYRLEHLFTGRFPIHALYGYRWHESRHLHLFSISDLRDFCREVGAKPTRLTCTGIKNAWGRSWSAPIRPNLLGRFAIMEITRGPSMKPVGAVGHPRESQAGVR